MSQTSDNNKRIAKNTLLLLFSNAVLDGCIVVYGAMYIVRMSK